MRFRDIKNYFKLKKKIKNPWKFIKLRKEGIDGSTYRIDFVDGGHFTIRDTPQDRHIFNNIFAEDE